MIKMKQTIGFVLITVFLAVLLTISCGDDGKVRKYKEKSAPVKAEKKSPHGKMNMPSMTPGGSSMSRGHGHFKWETPEKWKEEKKSWDIKTVW